MIKSFRHKGLEKLYRTGSTAGVNPQHAKKLKRQLARLETAEGPQDMNIPGWRLHPLKGWQSGHWSVTVRGNWRMTFAFEEGDAILVDYRDYH